jgi:glycerophosphoryl diester phosphodiesterase
VRPRARRSAVDPSSRPSVVAHRGASSTVAEHTLGAYLSAIEAGAAGLECDVRLTRDGHLVCVHDRTVNRTSNGRGVVSELDLQRLEALDFKSWRVDLPMSADELVNESPYLAGVEPDLNDDGRVLTLERLLGLVHDAGRPVQLLIETKHPTRYGGLVEKELVEMLDRFGWAGRSDTPERRREPADLGSPVFVMSSASTALRRIKLLAPDLPTVMLMEWRVGGLRESMVPQFVPVAGPAVRVLRADPEFVDRAHARGKRVFAWTVNERADIDFVCDLGVDTLITDRPREVLAHLSATR